MNYVRKLAFEETPNYNYLRGLMDNVLKNLNTEDDGLYDWVYVIDRRRKEKEKEKERRNDLIYPQKVSSCKNLYNSGKIQQIQNSLHYHSNYNSQDFHQLSSQNDLNKFSSKTKINEMLSCYSSKQPVGIQMQLQNSTLRNSMNLYNSRNSRKFQNYRQFDKLTRSKSYDRYNKYDDTNNIRYTDKEEYEKLMLSDYDLQDQKYNKYDYADNQRNYKNKLKSKNVTKESEKTSCFKHMFLCCYK